VFQCTSSVLWAMLLWSSCSFSGFHYFLLLLFVESNLASALRLLLFIALLSLLFGGFGRNTVKVEKLRGFVAAEVGAEVSWLETGNRDLQNVRQFEVPPNS